MIDRIFEIFEDKVASKVGSNGITPRFWLKNYAQDPSNTHGSKDVFKTKFKPHS